MKIQIPHEGITMGETGGDLWLATSGDGRVLLGVVGAETVKVSTDGLIAALEAIEAAHDHHEELPMALGEMEGLADDSVD